MYTGWWSAYKRVGRVLELHEVADARKNKFTTTTTATTVIVVGFAGLKVVFPVLPREKIEKTTRAVL